MSVGAPIKCFIALGGSQPQPLSRISLHTVYIPYIVGALNSEQIGKVGFNQEKGEGRKRGPLPGTGKYPTDTLIWVKFRLATSLPEAIQPCINNS